MCAWADLGLFVPQSLSGDHYYKHWPKSDVLSFQSNYLVAPYESYSLSFKSLGLVSLFIFKSLKL